MATVPHLIFRQRGLLYGIRATCVREIIWLPELTPVEEAPAHVVGVFNFRGMIVPVMNLSILFGHGVCRYNLTDALIVLESGSRLAGIIVNEVIDMMEASAEAVQPLPEFGRDGSARHRLVEGEAKAGDELVMVINFESLMRAVSEVTEGEPISAAGATFCLEASEEERKTFHARAMNLGKAVRDVEAASLQAVAVIALNGEYFGVGLDSVREFSNITGLVPVPCCPPHILGNMNLRGNVLTIIDIREALNMQAASKTILKKAVVSDAGGFTAGIAVEDVFEVVYMRGTEIKPSGSVVQYGDKYIKGTMPYDGKMVAYIDLRKILSREDIAVNEEA